jgi:hypothetical protein
MAVFTMPFDRVARVDGRTLVAATGSARSPFTGRLQVQDWGGAWWRYDITIGISTQHDARMIGAFFTRLKGPVHTFLFADPSLRNIDNYITMGEPTVRGAGQSGNLIATEGWVPGIYIHEGMGISLGTGAATRMHMIVEPVFVDALGRADFVIEPALREAPANGAPVEYLNPQVHLRLSQAVPAAIERGDIHRFSFTAEEAL